MNEENQEFSLEDLHKEVEVLKKQVNEYTAAVVKFTDEDKRKYHQWWRDERVQMESVLNGRLNFSIVVFGFVVAAVPLVDNAAQLKLVTFIGCAILLFLGILTLRALRRHMYIMSVLGECNQDPATVTKNNMPKLCCSIQKAFIRWWTEPSLLIWGSKVWLIGFISVALIVSTALACILSNNLYEHYKPIKAKDSEKKEMGKDESEKHVENDMGKSPNKSVTPNDTSNPNLFMDSCKEM